MFGGLETRADDRRLLCQGGAGADRELILAPVLVVVGLFLVSGIIHLCLMLLGGARRGFEATFRVMCVHRRRPPSSR